MTKLKKVILILLIVAGALILSGSTIFFISFASSGWDVHALGNVVLTQHDYTETAESPVSSISIDFKNADVEVIFNADVERVEIGYPQTQNKRGKALSRVNVETTQDGVKLTERIYSSFLVWNFTSPKVTVSLPAGRSFTLTMETDNGDITVNGGEGSVESLTLETDNGDINTAQSAITATKDIRIDADNGNIRLGDLTADKATVSTDNGDIYANGNAAIAQQLSLESDNGDVTISGTLTASHIGVETDNGDIRAKDGLLDGKTVVLSTDHGDIRATLAGMRSDYMASIEQGLGDRNVSSSYGETPTDDRVLKIEVDIGDIAIDFLQ